MLVTTARMGESFRNEPSLSSDSTTRNWLWPSRAFEPPMDCSRPPTTTVGSWPAWLNMVASIEVVVVLPWLPATGDAVLEAHQLGQQLAAGNHRDLPAPRFLHLGVFLGDRGANHHRPGRSDIRCGVPLVYGGAQAGQALRDRREPQVGAADGVAQIQQNLRDPAHPDAADAGEVQMLWLKEHSGAGRGGAGYGAWRHAERSAAASAATAFPIRGKKTFLKAIVSASAPHVNQNLAPEASCSSNSAARSAACGCAKRRAASPIRSSTPDSRSRLLTSS